MNTNEAGVSKSKSGPVRIVILTVVLIAAFVIALATGLPQIQKFISNPGTIFPDDRVLQGAIEKLSVADARIRVFPGDENAHLERAKSYILLGHLEGAEMEWEEWKDADNPEWGEIGRQVEELRLKTDEIRKLVHEAENSQRPSENYPPVYNLLNDISERYEGIPRYRALFLKGYLLLREGRKAEALDVLTGDVQDYPVLKPYVMYNTGRAMLTDELREDALEYFNEFIAEYPSHRLAPLAMLERINILRDLERFDDAISECNRCIENYPSSEFAPKALRKLAEIYEGGFDFDNGAIVRVRLVEEYPESDEVDETLEKFFNGVYSTDLIGDNQKLILGYAGTSGYPRDALSLLSDLVDSGELTSEERSMAAHGAGLCEYYLGHYYDCIDWAKKAIEISPESDWAARAGIRMGHAYLKLDKYENARDAYAAASRSSSELAPLAAEILYEKAYEQKDLDTFENACELIVNEYPDSDECPVAMTWLAYLGCRESEYQTALGYAERCISAFPETASSAEAEFWMARALEGLGRGSEAISAYEDLAARVPWNYWGIRSREILSTEVEVDHVDPYDFSYETLSSLNPGLSEGMELYYTGSLDLALAEFEHSKMNGVRGATACIALIHGEQENYRQGILAIRQSSALGDQSQLTPYLQGKLLETLYIFPYMDQVRNASLAHDVHPSWLWGTMRQESAYNKSAHSVSGARGLIQIMPETGRFIADRRGASTFDPDTLWDPSLNVDYAAWYFDYLRTEIGSGNLQEVLAAYNGGPGRLRQYRTQLPTRDIDIFLNAIPREETRNFTHWVYENIIMYQNIMKDKDFQEIPF